MPSLRVLAACATAGNVQLGATVIDVSLMPADQLPAMHGDDDARTEAEIEDLKTDRPTEYPTERLFERITARTSERPSEQTTEVDRPTEGQTDWAATELPMDRPSELRSPTEMKSPSEMKTDKTVGEAITQELEMKTEKQTVEQLSTTAAEATSTAAPVSEGSSKSSKKRRAARRNTQPLRKEDLPPRPVSGEMVSSADTLSTIDSFHTADAMEPSYASDDPTSGQITPVPNEEVFDYDDLGDSHLPSAELLEKALSSRSDQFSPVFFGGEDVELADDGAVPLEVPAEAIDKRLSKYMFGEIESAPQVAIQQAEPEYECQEQRVVESQQAAVQQDYPQPQPGAVSRRPLLLSPAVSQKSEDSNRGLSFDEELSPEAYEAHLTSQGVVAVMHAVVTGEHLPEEYLGEIGRALTPQTMRMTLSEEGARDRAGLVMRLFSAALSDQELSQGVLEEVEQALAPHATVEPLTEEAATAVKTLVEVLETAQTGDPKVAQRRGERATVCADVLEMAAETLPGLEEKASAQKILTLFQKLPEVARAVEEEVVMEDRPELTQDQTKQTAHQALAVMQKAIVSDVTDGGSRVEQPSTSSADVMDGLSPNSASETSQRLIDVFQAVSQGESVPEESLREIERALTPAAARSTEESEPKLTVDKIMTLVKPVLEESSIPASPVSELPRALSPQEAQEVVASDGAHETAQRLLTVLQVALTSETTTDSSFSDLTQTLSPTEAVITEVPKEDRSGASRVLAAVRAAMQDTMASEGEVSDLESAVSPVAAQEASVSEGPKLNVQKLMTALQAATAEEVVSDGTLSELSSLSQQQANEKLTPEAMKMTAEKVLNILQTASAEETISEGSLFELSSQQSPSHGEVKDDESKLMEKVTAIMRAVVSGDYVPEENLSDLQKPMSPAAADETMVSEDCKRKADLILTELRAMLYQEDVSEANTSEAISPIPCETAAEVPSHEDKLEAATRLMAILHADPMSPSISEGTLSEMTSIQDPSLASTGEQSGDSLQIAVATKVLAAAKAAETEVCASEGSIGKVERALSPQEAKQMLTPEEASMAVQKALEIMQAVCVGEEVPQYSLRELERVLSPVEAAGRITSPLMETEVKQTVGLEEASSLPTVETPVEATDRITSPLQETQVVETTGLEQADSIITTEAPVGIEERVTSPLQTALATETAGVQDTIEPNIMSATEMKEEETPTLQPLQITETVGVEGTDSISEIASPKEAGERITSPLQVLRIEETDGVEETESLPSLASSAKAEDRNATPLQSTEVSDVAVVEEAKALDSVSPAEAGERLTTPLQTVEVTETARMEDADSWSKVDSQAEIMETPKPPTQPLQATEPSEMTEPGVLAETSEASQADQCTTTPLEAQQVTETLGSEETDGLSRTTADEVVAARVDTLGDTVDATDDKVIDAPDAILSPNKAEVQERLAVSQSSVTDENIVSESVVESLGSAPAKASEESAGVVSPDTAMSALEAQIENVKVQTASEVPIESPTHQNIPLSEDVEMQEEDSTSMKSSDSVVTVTSLRKQGSDDLAGEDVDTLQQPSEVRQLLHAMEMLSTAVCTAAAATLAPEQPAEERVEVLGNDFLVSLESLCGGLESDRLREMLNKLCDKIKVNDKLSQEATANAETLQALEGISPMIQRTIYPKVNQVCEEIERLSVEASAIGNTPQAAAFSKRPEDAIGDQVQKLVDAVEETNQMKLRTLKHPVDDNSIARKFDDINDSVVHLAETVKKIVSSAMTGSADLSLQVTAVQQSLAVAVVTLTDLIANDDLRDEAIKLLAAVNGGISRVSDAAEASAQALKSDDSPEMNLAIQALLDEALKDIVVATNKFKEDMKEVTMTMRNAAATSAEDGVSKFLMQGEAFDTRVEDLTMAIESITAKKKRVASDVKSMKKISGESAGARTSVDTILKMICNTVTGASKADEDQALKNKLIEADAHLESLGQKFCNSLALPQPTKELIAQKVKKAKASLEKLVTACVQNAELLRAAKDVKIKRRSLSPNQSRAVQDLENIRSSFDQAIGQMRLMLAAQRPDDSTQKLFENLEAMVSALNNAEKSVLACAGTAAAAPQQAEQQAERKVKKSSSDSAVKSTKEEDAASEPKSLNEASASLNASITSLTEVVEETAKLKLPSATSIEDLTWSVCETVQSFITAVQKSSSVQVDQPQVQRLNDVLAALTATVADTPAEACAALDDSAREKVQKEISDVGICSAVLKQAVQNMTILVEEGAANDSVPVEHVVKKQLANVSEAVEKLNAAVFTCNRAIRQQLETSQQDPDIPIDERATRFQEASVSLIHLATSAVTANDKGSLGQLSKLGQTVKQAAMSLMAGMQRHSCPVSESQAIRFVAAVNEAIDSLLDTTEYALKSSEPEQEESGSVDTAIETISERCRAAEASVRHVALVTGEHDVGTALPGACEQLAQSFAALTSAIEDVVEARSESPGVESSSQRRVVAENCERLETQLQALCEVLIAKPATTTESLDALAEQSEAFYLSLLELLVAVRAQPTEDMSSQVMEACMKMRRQLEPLPSLLAELETQPTEIEMRESVSKLNKAAMTLVAGSKKSLQLEPSIKDDVLTSWIVDITEAIKEMLPERPPAAREDAAMETDDMSEQNMDEPSVAQANTQDVTVSEEQEPLIPLEQVDTSDVVMAEKMQDEQDFMTNKRDDSDAKVETTRDAAEAAEQDVSGKLAELKTDLGSPAEENIVAEVPKSPSEVDAGATNMAQVTSTPLTSEVEEVVEKLSKDLKASLGNSDENKTQTTVAEEVIKLLDRLESEIVQQGKPEAVISSQAFASLKQEVVELGELTQLPSVNKQEDLETSAKSAIESETSNLHESLTALAVSVENNASDRGPMDDEVIAEKVKAISPIIEKLAMAIKSPEYKQTPAESKTPESAPSEPETKDPMPADDICKDGPATDGASSSPSVQQESNDAHTLEESLRKEVATSDSVPQDATSVGSVLKELTVADFKEAKPESLDMTKESPAGSVNDAPKETVPVVSTNDPQPSTEDVPKGTASKESASTEEVAASSGANEPAPMDLSPNESADNDSKAQQLVPADELSKESRALQEGAKQTIIESTETREEAVAGKSVTRQPAQAEQTTSKEVSGDCAVTPQPISEVPTSKQPDRPDTAAKEQLLAACQSLNETADNFTAALVDALSSQPSPGMLRSRAESISGVISELAATLSVLTDNKNVAPQLQQLNDTVLQLAASVEGSSQTFDDATPLDNRVLEELVAPAIMEVSANIHTLRESVGSFTAQLAEAPTEMISDITESHVAMVQEASENISSAVQEVGLAISNAVEKSRTESFVSADEDTSSMLLDDALQDLSESTTGPVGERGGAWRRLSDLEMLEDGKIDTENILNVMSAIGSLKLLQKLSADSESLTDAVGRISMTVEQLSSKEPAADETEAPTPLEVRAVCGTLHASIDELTRTVRDLVSDAGCSELDSSLISKIEDYKDTLLSVSAVTDNLMAGRPELTRDGELIRASIDHLFAQADSILALTAEKSTIARSLQDAEEAQQPLDAATNKKLQGICSIVTSALEHPQTSEAFGIEAELASEAPYLMEILLHPENQQHAKQVTEGSPEAQMATTETVTTLKDASPVSQTSQNVQAQSCSKAEELAAQLLQAPHSMDDKDKTPTPSEPETGSKPQNEMQADLTAEKKTAAKQNSETTDVRTAVTEKATEDTKVPRASEETTEKPCLEATEVSAAMTEKTPDVTHAVQYPDVNQKNIGADDTKEKKKTDEIAPEVKNDCKETPKIEEKSELLKETPPMNEKPERPQDVDDIFKEPVKRIEADTNSAPVTPAVQQQDAESLPTSETAKKEVMDDNKVIEDIAKKPMPQTESKRIEDKGPTTVQNLDIVQQPVSVEPVSESPTNQPSVMTKDVDSTEKTNIKVSDTELPSAAKDRLMDEPALAEKSITQEPIKLEALTLDELTKEPVLAKDSIAQEPTKLETSTIDESQTKSKKGIDPGSSAMESSDVQQPAYLEPVSESPTMTKDVDSTGMTKGKVSDTEIPSAAKDTSAAKDRLMDEPALAEESIAQEPIKLEALTVDELTKEPVLAKDSIAQEPIKFDTSTIDESQTKSKKVLGQGSATVESSDKAQQPASVEPVGESPTLTKDVDSAGMTKEKVSDTELPSAAKDRLMEDPASAEESITQEPIKLEALTVDELIEEPVLAKDSITQEPIKLEALTIDEPGDSKKSIPAQKLEALVIDEPSGDKVSVVGTPGKLDVLSIDEVGMTETNDKLANLGPLAVGEAVTESILQPVKGTKLEALAIDEPKTPKEETVEKIPRLKRLSIEGSGAPKDANEPSEKKDEITEPPKAPGEEKPEKLVRLKVFLDDPKTAKDIDTADSMVSKKRPDEGDHKPMEPAGVPPSKAVPETVESSTETLADIVRRAVGGEIATIKEAQSAAERVRTALASAAESLQESGRELPGFRSQTSAIGADLALVTDALQDTIRSIRGTKMATKIQKDRINDMVKPAAMEVCFRVDSLVAAVQNMTETLKSSPTPEANAACKASADAVSTELQNLSTAIDKSNDVRSDAVERMKGLEDKMVVTEKTAEFKEALRDLLSSVECALVERGPGSDAVVNLQAASSRHAAAKMVTAVTSVTGDRVLPERAQETIEANIAAVAREAVAVTAHMRGTVPFEELVVVYQPLQERLAQLRQIEEDMLSAPGALADAAEATPVPEFNNLFLESVKDATSSTSALTKVLRDIGDEHANATKAYHGREARKIVGEDLDALRKSTDKFFSLLVGSTSGSGSSGNSWERESLIVAKSAEGVHKSINDLQVLEPAVRDSALSLRSGDVMKHASGVLNKCAKQLGTLMDRVPPGKTISEGCGIDKVAEKVAQLGDKMDTRLKTGAVENDENIETAAEEVQNAVGSCMKKIRKELKMIDDELEVEEEERRTENKKKKMEEAEQKVKEAEAQREEEEEKRKKKAQQMKDQLEKEEKEKEEKEEKERLEDAKKRKKRKTVEKDDNKEEKKEEGNKSKTVDEGKVESKEGTSSENNKIAVEDKVLENKHENQTDAQNLKADASCDIRNAAEDEQSEMLQKDEESSKPRKASGKLDPSLIVERRIIPPQEDIEAKKLQKKLKSQDSSDVESKSQKTEEGDVMTMEKGEPKPSVDQTDKAQTKPTSVEKQKSMREEPIEVQKATASEATSLNAETKDADAKDVPASDAQPRRKDEEGDEKSETSADKSTEKTNDAKKKVKKTKSKEKKKETSPEKAQTEDKKEKTAPSSPKDEAKERSQDKTARGADDPDKIPRVLRAEDQLARAVGETSPPEPEAKTGKRKKSVAKTEEPEETKTRTDKNADKTASTEAKEKQASLGAKEEEVQKKEAADIKKNAKADKKEKEPSGFAAAPRESDATNEPGKLSQDKEDTATTSLQKKPSKELEKKVEEKVEPAPEDDKQKKESVAPVEDKPSKTTKKEKNNDVGPADKAQKEEVPAAPVEKPTISKQVPKAEHETKQAPSEKLEKVETKPDEKDSKPSSEKKRKKRRDKDAPKPSKEDTTQKPVMEPERAPVSADDSKPTEVPREPAAAQAAERERLMSPDGIQRRRRESAEHYVVSIQQGCVLTNCYFRYEYQYIV